MFAAELIRLSAARSARRFEAATKDPERVQEAKLLALLSKNRDTEYGRRYGFASIRSIEDYQGRVPLVTYDDIQDLMIRVTRGEKGILTAEDPIMFAQTSGTTGEPKYVPITPTCQGRDHADVMRTWLYHAIRAHPGIFRSCVVSLVSPAVEGHTPSGIPFGSASGLIYRNMPRIIRSCYAIPYEIFEIRDYEAKYYALMRIGIAADVRLVSSANPSSIIKMCEKGDQHAEAILRDIHDGTLSRAFEIDDRIRAEVQRRLRPDPSRARELGRLRDERGGRLIPADYWPRLELIGCWKGGTVGSYLSRFPEWFHPDGRPPVAVRDWGFLSSEARCSIPLTDEGSAGVLTVATNVYEFVEVEDLESRPDSRDLWRFLRPGELRVGGEYYIFFTTSGGLYRYDINDVIRVTARWNRTPVIEFLRKGRGMTSITGEKLSVNQVIQAFDDAGSELGIPIDHFRAEADQARSRYVFKIEPGRPLSRDEQEKLLRRLDGRLREINIEYKGKRESQRIGNPILHVMKSGWYEAAKKSQVAAGKRLFQAKTILLAFQDPARPADPFVESTLELDSGTGA